MTVPPTSRSLADSNRWTREGTCLVLDAVGGLGETGLAVDSGLPGWSRKHLVGHLAANADALGNLVHWAATGVETPMYASVEERSTAIERAASLPAVELESWLRSSAAAFGKAIAALGADQWQRRVVTAQGREVPATEIPWLRAREVNVHAVDLAVGTAFSDLSADFCEALCIDIMAKRSLTALPPEVAGAPLAEITAWLTGRPHTLASAPALDPWL